MRGHYIRCWPFLLGSFLAAALILVWPGSSFAEPDRVEAVPLPDGRLAMSAFMLGGNDRKEEEWRAALRQMRDMGVELVEIGQIGWRDVEKAPGKYQWGYAETVLRINKQEKLGLRFIADIGMFINPGLDGKVKLPEHLSKSSFDDPVTIRALVDLYRSFLGLPGAEDVSYLFQHFENAEASLRGRPADRERVKVLLRESFAAARLIRPDLKTGVCIESYEKPHWPASMIRDWNLDIGTDVVPLISFGPTNFVKSPEEELATVLKTVSGKPVALNECWCHSSKGAGSSDAAQASFIRQLFALLRKHHHSIELATWFEFSDLPPLTANVIGAYLAGVTGNPLLFGQFKERMGSCGLVGSDLRPKPSLAVWCREARRYYQLRSGRPVRPSRP